ncbi:hypothetical protein Tco_0945471 [Tanacetum coccineum]
MSAFMEARIAEHAATTIPPTSPTYDQAPLGHRAAMIRMRDDIPKEDMPPRRRFVLTAPPPGCDVAESSAGAAARPPRAADRVEDVGYVRALQASEHRMMTSIEELNLRVHQAYLSSEARNRALLVRLETLETHMSCMKSQCQRAEDHAVGLIMRTQVLEARAHIDTVKAPVVADDASQSSGGGLKRLVQPARVCSYTDFMKCQPLNFKGTKGVVGLSLWLENMESVFYISGCPIDNQVKFATCTLLGAALTW